MLFFAIISFTSNGTNSASVLTSQASLTVASGPAKDGTNTNAGFFACDSLLAKINEPYHCLKTSEGSFPVQDASGIKRTSGYFLLAS